MFEEYLKNYNIIFGSPKKHIYKIQNIIYLNRKHLIINVVINVYDN